MPKPYFPGLSFIPFSSLRSPDGSHLSSEQDTGFPGIDAPSRLRPITSLCQNTLYLHARVRHCQTSFIPTVHIPGALFYCLLLGLCPVLKSLPGLFSTPLLTPSILVIQLVCFFITHITLEFLKIEVLVKMCFYVESGVIVSEVVNISLSLLLSNVLRMQPILTHLIFIITLER